MSSGPKKSEKEEVNEDDSWLAAELGETKLGDKRLDWRLIEVARKLSALPAAPINQACDDWADTKAAYRLFGNEKVTGEKILKGHQQRTQERMRQQELVLAVQDTTYLNYSHHPSKKDRGPIGSKKGVLRGYVMHKTMALNGQGLPLGILTQSLWAREESEAELSDWEKTNRPIAEKESNKWLTAFTASGRLRPEGVKMVTVCDREADIYELFVAAQIEVQAAATAGGAHHLLVRATQNRKLTGEGTEKLHEHVAAQPIVAHLKVLVPARDNEPAREAIVSVNGPANLDAPYRSKKVSPEPLPPISLTAILVQEVNPPPAVKKPLKWLLLTNFPLPDFATALECIQWYRYRWHIEVYFKVLKSGCTIEECRLENSDRLFPYLALMAVIAWRLFWLTHINRHDPEAPCIVIFADHEWQALYAAIQRNIPLPDQPPTVYQAVRWMAQLGGFLARKSDREPGVTTIWRGWIRLQDKADSWLLARSVTYG